MTESKEHLQEAPGWFKDAVSRPRSRHAVASAGQHLHVAGWNADDTDKAPLLFVHGFRGNSHWWDFIAPFFTGSHRVFAMDFSGMGESDRRPVYEPHHFFGDVAAVARWLKADAGGRPVTVVGHSFGGSRTLEACGRHPGLIDHAIVLDSMLRLASDPQHAPQPLGRPTPYLDEASAVARFRLLPEQPALPCLRDHIARHAVAPVAGGWSWQFDLALPTALEFGVAEELLPAVRSRVDLVRGELSQVLSAERAGRIAALLPALRGPIVMPQTHHHLMLDQPLALVSTLRTLLA